MKHKKNILMTFVLLPLVFSICLGFLTSCLTVQYNEAADSDGDTVTEEVIETEEADDDDE